MEDIPRDIWEDIMLRLSPEAVVRSMLVHPCWYNHIKSLVEDPIFVKMLMHKQQLHSQSCLIFKCNTYFCTPPLPRKPAHVTIFNAKDSYDSLIAYNADCLNPLSEHSGIFLAGSHCHGILCVTNFSRGQIVLLNPTTRDFTFLDTKETPCKVRVGFGYDPIFDVYKVVRVVGPYTSQVYTLGDNNYNYWRDVKSRTKLEYFPRVFPMNRQLYCNGVIYWLVFSYGRAVMVQAFDVHDEEFYDIPVPDTFRSKSLKSSDVYWANLLDWNGTIALSCCHQEISGKPIEIWKLCANRVSKEGRHKMSSECWIKLPSIYRPDRIPRKIVAFLNKDELLMKEGKFLLVAYNLRSRDMRVIYRGPMKFARVFPFVKSLVSVSDLNKTATERYLALSARFSFVKFLSWLLCV